MGAWGGAFTDLLLGMRTLSTSGGSRCCPPAAGRSAHTSARDATAAPPARPPPICMHQSGRCLTRRQRPGPNTPFQRPRQGGFVVGDTAEPVEPQRGLVWDTVYPAP